MLIVLALHAGAGLDHGIEERLGLLRLAHPARTGPRRFRPPLVDLLRVGEPESFQPFVLPDHRGLDRLERFVQREPVRRGEVHPPDDDLSRGRGLLGA